MPLTADELAQQLRDDILSGRLPTGVKLPSLNELVQSRGVGKGVAQLAINKLRAEGLIASRHGAGNFVQGGFGRSELLRSEFDEWSSLGQDAERQQVVTRVDEVPAPDFVARHLDVDAGGNVVVRQWFVERKGRPSQLHDTYFPVDIARGSVLLYHDLGPSGLTGRLAEMGHDPDRFEERLVARSATGDEGDQLELRVGSVVIEVKRATYAGGRCVAVSRAVFDASLYELAYEVTR